MAKYLFYGSYTPEGYKGLLQEGGSRRIEAAKQALKSAGGSLEAFYFSFRSIPRIFGHPQHTGRSFLLEHG